MLESGPQYNRMRPERPLFRVGKAVLAGVLFTLALAVTAFVTRLRAPAFASGLAVFALLLAPTFSIVRFSPVIAYDRYLHLPALGLALALAFALVAASRRRRVAMIAAVLAVALAEALATRAAISPWRDSIAIWERAVQVSPNSAVAHNGLGATFSGRGETARAIAAHERSSV